MLSPAAACARAAAKELRVADAIDRRDRQTDGQRTVLPLHKCSLLEARAASVIRIQACKKWPKIIYTL